MSLLQKIKSGKNNTKTITFPGTEHELTMIILSSDATMKCKIQADEYTKKVGIEEDIYKDTVLQQYLAYEFLRDKDDLNKRIAESFNEFRSSVDNVELVYFITQYNLFMSETSPFLSAVTEEQFEELKKTLEKMTLNDLSGESCLALRNFLLSLV